MVLIKHHFKASIILEENLCFLARSRGEFDNFEGFGAWVLWVLEVPFFYVL